MRTKHLLVAALVALAAQPALAGGAWTNCSNPADATGATGAQSAWQLNPRGLACYQWDDALNSPMVNMLGGGRFCLDPDQGGTGGAARVQIYECPYGITGLATSGTRVTDSQLQQCHLVSGLLDGVGGAAGAQSACSEHLAAGRYVVDVTIAPGVGEEPVVTALGD